jgi:hypothetical protein
MFQKLAVLFIVLVMLASVAPHVMAQSITSPYIRITAIADITPGCEGHIGTVYVEAYPGIHIDESAIMMITVPATFQRSQWPQSRILSPLVHYNFTYNIHNGDLAGPFDTVRIDVQLVDTSVMATAYVFCATGTWGRTYVDNHQFTAVAIEAERVNHGDVAAPVAAYLIEYASGTGLHHYAVDSAGHGSLALEVTPEMIAAVPEHPDHNTLIASSSDGTISLYRLTTGEFQINAHDYVTVFHDLHPGAYHYTP